MFMRQMIAAAAILSLTAIGPNVPAVAQSNDVRFVLDFLLQGQQSAFVLGRERGYYSEQRSISPLSIPVAAAPTRSPKSPAARTISASAI